MGTLRASISDLLRGPNELIHVKTLLAQCLAHSTHSENVSYYYWCLSDHRFQDLLSFKALGAPQNHRQASKNAQLHFRPTEPQSHVSPLLLQNSQMILSHSQG